MNASLNNLKKQLGLSLIELLIAMVIGFVLIGGIAQIFISVQRSNNLLIAETALQENARFAFLFITRIVEKSAGFGCTATSDTNMKSLLNFSEDTFRPWVGIEGWEANNTGYGAIFAPNTVANVAPTNHWKGANGAALDETIESVEKSDIVSIWYTAQSEGALSAVTTDDLEFSEINIEQGDIIVINDCNTVVFAQACQCDNSDSTACEGGDEQAKIAPSACNTPGNVAFSPDSINLDTGSVHVLKRAVFSVGIPSTERDVTSLFMHSMGKDGKLGGRVELLEGLESLQIRYGEDINGNKSPNYYVDAEEVQDWQNVISIRLSLLMRSLNDGLLTEPQTLYFNGAQVNIAEGDSYLRRTFDTTISLRNRNIGY